MTISVDTTLKREVKNQRYRRNLLLVTRVTGEKMGLFSKETYFSLLRVCTFVASEKDMDVIESILDGVTEK